MTIGDRIRMRREELHLSQEELGRRVGYKSRSSVNKLELSRTLPTNKIMAMADALECSPSYLMGWADLDGTPINQSLTDFDECTIIEIFRELPQVNKDALLKYARFLSKS